MRSKKNVLLRKSKKKMLFIFFGIVILVVFSSSGLIWALRERLPSGILINHKFKSEVLGLDCTFCHEINTQNTRFMTFPGHDICSSCHGEAVNEKSEDKDCTLCHYLPNNETHVRKDTRLSPLVKFDHKLHEEKGISCEQCHPVSDSSKIVANEMLPSMQTCTTCHTERHVMEASDCSGCHIKGYEKIEPMSHTTGWKSTHGEGLSRKVIDSDCRTCHTPELKNSCTDCHHRKQFAVGKKGYCDACHVKGFAETRPKDHTPFWDSNHGKGLTQARIDTYCTLCHTPQSNNDCLDCHRKEKPKSHTIAWRIHSHGSRAQIDRESCSVCHNQSECISCHTTNEPFSHTALWGSPNDRHCINCHMEGGNFASGEVGSNCTFCHQSSRVWAEHTSLQKPGHHVTTDCTNCHSTASFIGPRIRHPYNPDTASCKSCHQ